MEQLEAIMDEIKMSSIDNAAYLRIYSHFDAFVVYVRERTEYDSYESDSEEE